MRAQFLAIVFVVLLTSPSAAQTPPPDRLQHILDSGTLRVGTTMDTPVFSMRTSSGQLEGFDMDALATLAPALGVKIDYVKMTFGSMLSDLAADKFDIAMSGMGRTLDRARTATFSKPYMRYGKLMAVRNADRDRFKSISDLDKPGVKIAYNKGGLNETFACVRFQRIGDCRSFRWERRRAGRRFDGGTVHGAAGCAHCGDGPCKRFQSGVRRDFTSPRRPNPSQLPQHLD